jgi:hypothetical protein
MHSLEYVAYLQSNAWKAVRNRKLSEGKKCKVCEVTNHLVVHHIHYHNLKNENMEDLVVLCEYCHNELHNTKPGILSIEEHTKNFLGKKRKPINRKLYKNKPQKKKYSPPKLATGSVQGMCRRIPKDPSEQIGEWVKTSIPILQPTKPLPSKPKAKSKKKIQAESERQITL